MAKNSITDYSKTASLNTDIQSVDIDEGCLPSGINNAIRELMADLAAMNDGTVSLTSPSFAAASLTGDLSFGDNDKAIFGAGNDLQIYHDGNNSIIKDAGTGSLVINTNTFQLANAANTETILNAVENGAVTLYYDNATKLATTSTGIDVTGTVTADGLTVDTNTLHVDSTNNRVGIGTSSPSAVLHTKASGQLLRLETTQAIGSGYLSIYDSSALKGHVGYLGGADDDFSIYNGENSNTKFFTNGSERMRIDSSGNVGIGTSSPAAELHINDASGLSAIRLTGGASGADNFQIMQGVTGVSNSGLSIYDIDATATRMVIDSSGQVGIGTSSPVKPLTIAVSDTSTISGVALNHGASNYWGFGSYTDQSFRIAKSHGLEDANTYFAINRSNGNVGIGTSSPSDTLHIKSSAPIIRLEDSDNSAYQWQVGQNTDVFFINTETASDGSQFAMDSSGNVLVGTTSQIEGSKVCISAANGLGVNITGAGGGALNANYVSTGTGYFGYFKYNGSVVGSITSTGSSTAYNTTSDYRLKENVTGITDGIERVKQLNPSRFNFIADADTTVDGFLAHEAQTVVPEAVHGTHNEVDDDGNPVYQGIDQAKLVPLLTAALQEAIAKIENLEARVATLEGN